jgi:hypothetical protein
MELIVYLADEIGVRLFLAASLLVSGAVKDKPKNERPRVERHVERGTAAAVPQHEVQER